MNIEYYVTSKDNLWNHRNYKQNKSPRWEKLKDDEITKVLATHKYNFNTFPDNDDFCVNIEYDVKIKKVTTEYL